MFKSITFRSNPNHPKGSVLQVILDLDSWIFQVGAGKEVLSPFLQTFANVRHTLLDDAARQNYFNPARLES